MAEAFELERENRPAAVHDAAAELQHLGADPRDTGAVQQRSRRLGASTLGALSVRPFRWWFISQVTSASGLMTQMVAMAWLVLQMTGSGLDLALMSTAALAPVLLLGLWAGTLIDHRETRSVLIFTQSAFTVLSLMLFALIESGHVSYAAILTIAAGSGTIAALDNPARQVYVQELVGREQLAGAISLYEVILNLSRVLGPALGGALLVASGPAACVLVNAISFLLPLAVLLHFRPQNAVSAHARPELRPKAMDGMRHAWHNPALRACLLLAAASGVLFNFSVLLPLLAVRVFHMGGGGYGLLLAIFGIGALPGALLASHSGEAPSGHQVRVLAILTGACICVVAGAPDVPLLYLGMAATGTSSIWMIAVANTLVQLRTEAALRGRVMGAWSVALPGTVPLTSLAAGGLADACGARVGYAATGVLIAAIGIAFWRSFGRH